MVRYVDVEMWKLNNVKMWIHNVEVSHIHISIYYTISSTFSMCRCERVKPTHCGYVSVRSKLVLIQGLRHSPTTKL